MKKFLFAILSVCLAFTFALSGCSCTTATILEFNASNTNNIKKETLVYDVKWEDTYKGIGANQPVDKSMLSYQDGELTLTFDRTGKELPEEAAAHVKFGNSEPINYIKSVFSINVVVGKGEEQKTYHDKIISEVYFYGAEWALAPAYSKTTVKNTFLAMDSTQVEGLQNIYEYTTLYQDGSFVMTKKYYEKQENEDIISADIENKSDYVDKLKSLSGDGASHTYALKTAIDNVQLIFAIRNLNIASGSSLILPTITYMYNKPMNLLIANTGESSLPLKLNGSSEDANMPINIYSISLSGTDHTGSTKYLSVQRSAIEGFENYALPVQYAESIYDSVSKNTIGALVYTLKEVNIITK